jgi:hypothetical protein
MFPENQRIASEVRKNDKVVRSHSRETDRSRGPCGTQGNNRRDAGALGGAHAWEGFEDDDCSHDYLVAKVIAARVFASATDGCGDEDEDESHAMPVQRYFARKAFNDAESEAKLVEALNDGCVSEAFIAGGDPAVAASLQRVAQTAWIHYHHARAAAEGADGDSIFGPLADRAVTRAHHAALAIKRAAGRAVTRAAILARTAARDRSRVPARLSQVRRPVGLRSRPRAPSARRVRMSAITSAGSGNEEPGPEAAPSGTRLAAGRKRAHAHRPRRDARACAALRNARAPRRHCALSATDSIPSPRPGGAR